MGNVRIVYKFMEVIDFDAAEAWRVYLSIGTEIRLTMGVAGGGEEICIIYDLYASWGG